MESNSILPSTPDPTIDSIVSIVDPILENRSPLRPLELEMPAAVSPCKPADPPATAAGYPQNRLRKHADYQQVYRAARKRTSASMAWFAAPQPAPLGTPATIHPAQSPARVGLTVGKPLGKAHERNRIKRRLRAVIATHHAELPAGVDLILHPRRAVITMDFAKLETEISQIFKQVTTLATRRGPDPGPASPAGPNQANPTQASPKRSSPSSTRP